MSKLLGLNSTFSIGAVVFLLASPAFGFLTLLGFGYFPNEKIALVIVILSRCSWRLEFLQFRLLAFAIALILGILVFMQALFGINDISIPAINSILIMFSLPFYASYLSNNPEKTLKTIFIVGVVQFLVSVFQQVMMFSGDFESATMFNNYPPQQFYIYPVAEAGYFFRTAGFFTESSSYAVFQWLSILSAYRLRLHKNHMIALLLFIMAIEAMLNGSIVGYLFISMYLIMSIKKTKDIVLYVVIIASAYYLLILIADGNYNILYVVEKITNQFLFMSDESYKTGRLYGMILSIELTLSSNYFLIGTGFSWLSPTLDFISLHLSAYGIIGFFALLTYVLGYLLKAPRRYRFAVLVVLSINGHLSSSINIILISLSFTWYIYQFYPSYYRFSMGSR